MTDWTADQPIVRLRDVHKSYGQVEVIRGISMDVMKGEVICIIGPSGSGKSTLIRCINALNDIQAGSIQVEGQQAWYDNNRPFYGDHHLYPNQRP